MKNLFEITKQDIITFRAQRGCNQIYSPKNERTSAITVGKLTASEINNAWKKALQNHPM